MSASRDTTPEGPTKGMQMIAAYRAARLSHRQALRTSLPSVSAADDQPMDVIGLGPGMIIRLGQIGIYTTGDLARADPAALREALGGISRLLDIEGWVARARQAVSPGGAPS